jgi:hypothetical protein
MKINFGIDKSYTTSHRILEYLYNDWNENNQLEQLIGSIKIAEKTNIPIAEIHKYQHILVNKGEIVVLNNDGQSMMSIQQGGATSYVEKKYIKEGRKLFFDNIFDWARIIIPLGALILSIINYVNNNNNAEKIEKIEIQIKKKQS